MTARIIRPAFTPVDKAEAELTWLLKAHRFDNRRIRELRMQLARAYAKKNGWVVARAPFHPAQVARRSNQTTRAGEREGFGWAAYPALDHLTFMREPGGWRLPAAILSQPYQVEPDQLADFCARWSLLVKVEMSFPAWYLPGDTPLLVFTPRNQEIGRDRSRIAA